jgi:integrase
LEAFFTDRLIRQRQVSPNTVQAYRDTMRLLLVFASERHGKPPGKLAIDDLDAPLIGAFLDHLEHERKNSVRTRNARLAAIRSLFRYAALRHPEHAATIERVLAIPPKRFERRLVTYLVGRFAEKFRFSRFGAMLKLWLLSVVALNFLFRFTAMPFSRISLPTRRWPTSSPSSFSSSVMRGRP